MAIIAQEVKEFKNYIESISSPANTEAYPYKKERFKKYQDDVIAYLRLLKEFPMYESDGQLGEIQKILSANLKRLFLDERSYIGAYLNTFEVDSTETAELLEAFIQFCEQHYIPISQDESGTTLKNNLDQVLANLKSYVAEFRANQTHETQIPTLDVKIAPSEPIEDINPTILGQNVNPAMLSIIAEGLQKQTLFLTKLAIEYQRYIDAATLGITQLEEEHLIKSRDSESDHLLAGNPLLETCSRLILFQTQINQEKIPAFDRQIAEDIKLSDSEQLRWQQTYEAQQAQTALVKEAETSWWGWTKASVNVATSYVSGAYNYTASYVVTPEDPIEQVLKEQTDATLTQLNKEITANKLQIITTQDETYQQLKTAKENAKQELSVVNKEKDQLSKEHILLQKIQTRKEAEITLDEIQKARKVLEQYQEKRKGILKGAQKVILGISNAIQLLTGKDIAPEFVEAHAISHKKSKVVQGLQTALTNLETITKEVEANPSVENAKKLEDAKKVVEERLKYANSKNDRYEERKKAHPQGKGFATALAKASGFMKVPTDDDSADKDAVKPLRTRHRAAPAR